MGTAGASLNQPPSSYISSTEVVMGQEQNGLGSK